MTGLAAHATLPPDGRAEDRDPSIEVDWNAGRVRHPRPFVSWLLEQAHRGDDVGLLAAAVLAGEVRPPKVDSMTAWSRAVLTRRAGMGMVARVGSALGEWRLVERGEKP